MHTVFTVADILIPREELLPLWSVVACDQFTSDPGYWDDVSRRAGDAPSACRVILPEAYLGATDTEKEIERINARMNAYLEAGIFREYPGSMVYVKREMRSGRVRKGIVGAVDLNAYDYAPGSRPKIRATEQTVLERIPPRVKIRKDASLELPHVLLLADDPEDAVFREIEARSSALARVYDFELMKNGGHISGCLLPDELCGLVSELVSKLEHDGICLAVGDGNHSLASAKACYETLKAEIGEEKALSHPARYALVELVNIRDEAIVFEPIHRYVFGTDPGALLDKLSSYHGNGFSVRYITGDRCGSLNLPSRGSSLACGALQSLLDEYLSESGGKIDYIHGDDTAERLAKEGGISFLLPRLDKASLFKTVAGDGVLPRKAFSMGHAEEKRYYLEARKIR